MVSHTGIGQEDEDLTATATVRTVSLPVTTDDDCPPLIFIARPSIIRMERLIPVCELHNIIRAARPNDDCPPLLAPHSECNEECRISNGRFISCILCTIPGII